MCPGVSELLQPCGLWADSRGKNSWSELPFPAPAGHPNPVIEPKSFASPTLAGRFFTTRPPEVFLYFFKFLNFIVHKLYLKTDFLKIACYKKHIFKTRFLVCSFQTYYLPTNVLIHRTFEAFMLLRFVFL